jgi:hypothetical protein
MSDTKQLLQRARRQFVAPEGVWDSLVRRRDRKRRNQRIAAGVVGIAVFVAAVWISTTGGPFDRIRTTVGTNPTVPPDPTRVGFIGLPPEGATPSAPERGELVLSFSGAPTATGGSLSRVWVYADGRLIWDREGDLPRGANEVTTGLLEQRLTPQGVELLRSEIISTGLFGHDLSLVSEHGLIWGMIEVRNGDRLVRVNWDDPRFQKDGATSATPEQASALKRLDARLTDPVSWLPASAWEEREVMAYVPSWYSVCYGGSQQPIELSRIFTLLPEPAADLLHAKDRTRHEDSAEDPYITFCSVLTTEEARTLAGILEDAMPQQEANAYARELAYILGAPGQRPGNGVLIFFKPHLPHDDSLSAPRVG